MNPELDALLEKLTLEEKAALVEGTKTWNTNAVPRLKIPALFMTDGPHGLRKVRRASGSFGIADNEHSTAFPTSAAVACSWEPENARQMGGAIAGECLAAGVDVLLAPGVNIKRSPLCGRNFEYFSEDPLLSACFGEAFVQGVQSRGVGCCVKHFAANSTENYRFIGDSVMDERALHEIYLRAFERIVRRAEPYAVMCAYNRVNGVFASENRMLLQETLREEWGYRGPVMTDWGATCNRVRGVFAGCDLDMPGDIRHNRRSILEAVQCGALPAAALDRAARHMLELIGKCRKAQARHPYDAKAHAALSEKIAQDSAVLLKNDGVLPLRGGEKLLAVGEMFEKMRYQGAGSSLINPPEVVAPAAAFRRRGIRFTYCKGYRSYHAGRSTSLEQEALAASEDADTVLFFGGLNDLEESEGFDRSHMRLPENQTVLLEKLLATGKKVVLVLYAGAPVELSFYHKLAALLDMVLPGMHGGEATAALLFGEVDPSGKLAESWPLRAQQSSCAADYGQSPVSRHYESIYVGYRFYDKAGTPLRFPFGYGLSYTAFAYRGMEVCEKDGRVAVRVRLANTGMRDGVEVVELYVRNAPSRVYKAEKELRAFCKIFLRAGEEKTAELSFEKADLAYWHAGRHAWVLENGTYELCAAASAADIRLTAPLVVSDGERAETPYSAQIDAAYAEPPETVPSCFDALPGVRLPRVYPQGVLTMESPLSEFRRTPLGWLLFTAVMHILRRDYKRAQRMPDSLERDARVKSSYFIATMLPYQSLRSISMSSSGQLQYGAAVALFDIMTGHPLRALRRLLGREKPKPPTSRR